MLRAGPGGNGLLVSCGAVLALLPGSTLRAMFLTEGGAVPMATVDRWTGREAKLLRQALRLSVRDFAARLGVGVRTVNKWEARQADITPLPHMQEVLDTALARASDEVKARFAAVTRADVPERETA